MGEAYVEAKQARNGKLAAPKLSQASILGEPSEQREQPQGLVDASRNKDESSLYWMSQLKTESNPATTKETAVVYVVDDEPMVGDVVQAILKMGGYESVLFSDPNTAFQALSEANPKPTLLLTDFQMPQMTGRELIQHCKKVHPALKTILYSGNVQEETVAFYPTRPDGFLRKPFTPKTLIDLVQSVLAD